MKNSLFTFVFNFPRNVSDIFWGKNLLWHALAISLTFVLVETGFDWQYHGEAARGFLHAAGTPAVWLGFFVPVAVPLAIFFAGAAAKAWDLLNTGFALSQAGALGWLVSAFYKMLTGRPGPVHAAGDITHVFRFGILRGGVFAGWPSSHTTVAFSMGAAIFALYPEKKFVRWLGLAYAAYIGLGVSVTIHWFSDFIAGIIFGTLVGYTVGKSFLERRRLQQLGSSVPA